MKNLKGEITISRINDGMDGHIEITIGDKNSHIQFVEAKISFENLTKALSGQGAIPIEFNVRNLDNVGKIREDKELVFPVSDFMNGKDEAELNCQINADVGWIASGYYRSQNSLRKHDDDKYYAHGTQFRFVDPKLKKEE